jgi:hypothetical protein
MWHGTATRLRSSGKKYAATGIGIFTLFALSTVCVNAKPSSIEPVQQAQAPVYHLGDTWTLAYDREDGKPDRLLQLAVTATAPATTRLSGAWQGGTPFEVDYDDMGCLTRSGDTTYKPSLGTVRFPMSVGMTWQANYRIISDKPIREVTAQVSVDGAEVIHVQAGDFFAFRLISHGVISIMHGSHLIDQKSYESTYWYAPAARRVVKSETKTYVIVAKHGSQSTQTFELRNYSSGAPNPDPSSDSEH